MSTLTTHVLDTYLGSAAAGVRVQLWHLVSQETSLLLIDVMTNQQGRCELSLNLDVGEYALHFFIGEYFKLILESSKPMFLNMIPIHFYIANTDQHYHVPLVVSPWAYSTYKGS